MVFLEAFYTASFASRYPKKRDIVQATHETTKLYGATDFMKMLQCSALLTFDELMAFFSVHYILSFSDSVVLEVFARGRTVSG